MQRFRLRGQRGVFTHVQPDLDAFCSVWAVRRYALGDPDAHIRYQSADWDGATLGSHFAVDLEAGGKGIKGEARADGRRSSAFRVCMERWAPEEDRRAIQALIDYVDTQDAHGSPFRALLDVSWVTDETTRTRLAQQMQEAQRVLSCYTISMVMRDMLAQHNNDWTLAMGSFGAWMDQQVHVGLGQLRRRAEAERLAQECPRSPSGRVALVSSGNRSLSHVLAEQGVLAIVWHQGNKLGISMMHGCTVPALNRHTRAVIEAVGEQLGQGRDLWFAHPDEFMLARGTRKTHEPSTPSQVNPNDLLAAMERALTEARS